MADNFNLRAFLTENKLTKNAKLLKEGTYLVTVNIPSRKMDIGSKQEASSEEEAIEKAIQYIEQEYPGVEYQVKNARLRQEAQPSTLDISKVDTNSIEIDGVDQNDRPDFADAYISYAEYEDGTPLTDGELEELTSEMPDLVNQLANDSLYEKTQNKKPMMKETNLTAKERRLVEMVNNAMGMKKENHLGNTNNDEDGEFDPGHDIEQAQHNIERQYEGEEMTQETVIPEYHNIDELMKSIDHGTNKVAEEHKIQEMKKIAEALRMKAKKMEESEHAAHISPKDLKQLATDAAKLEKAAEKLKAAFDKKFNKKEKPAAAAKAEKVEALQENKMENFDLKKFLVENKMTRNSRMVSEAEEREERSEEEGGVGEVEEGFFGKLMTGIGMASITPKALKGDKEAQNKLLQFFSKMSPEKQQSFIQYFKDEYVNKDNVPFNQQLIAIHMIAKIQDLMGGEEDLNEAKAEKIEALQENRMENFDLKKFLVENKLTANSRMLKEDIDQDFNDGDMEVIDGWYFSTNPQADELSPEEVEAGVQAHYEEWNAVKDQYNSIDDYFEDVERNGDWY